MEQPLVSILASSYNHKPFLEDFITSVYSQDYPNIELIMLDDGSTDDSPKKLIELSQKHGFFAECRENGGFPNALNYLRTKAHGKYIVIIAPDDILTPKRISKQVHFLEQNPDYAITCGYMKEIDEKGNEGKLVEQHFESGKVFEKLLRSQLYILAPTVMIRKTALDHVGAYDESLRVEDFDMWLRMAQHYPLGYQKELFAYYRIHSGNAHGNYHNSFSQKEQVLNKYKDLPIYSEIIGDFYRQAYLFLSGLKAYQDLAKYYGKKAKKHGVFHPNYLKASIKKYFKPKQ
ncbi:MAG: glycosyltransferase family 2 protein [Flavobacteriales bacterium]|jgi:alpha-1,3-rhamnosyltransferase|nr:glycosyltransferase family 2 protein [Flavobacteriales bacterium]